MPTNDVGHQELTRPDAERLFRELSKKARLRRRMRSPVVRLAVVFVLVAAALLPPVLLIGKPRAFAFGTCSRESSTQQPSLLGLLPDVPGIALISRAGPSYVKAEGVTIQCAPNRDGLAAIRVRVILSNSGRLTRLSVETWYADQDVQLTPSQGSIKVDGEPTKALAVDGRPHALAFKPRVPGVPLAMIEGLQGAPPARGLEVGIATQSETALASLYEASLGGHKKPAPHAFPDEHGETYPVTSVDEVLARVRPYHWAQVVVLPGASPKEVELQFRFNGLAMKTVYVASNGEEVSVVQSEVAYLPETGRAVTIRGATGKLAGTALYWLDRGYVLAVDARKANVTAYAERLEWVMPLS